MITLKYLCQDLEIVTAWGKFIHRSTIEVRLRVAYYEIFKITYILIITYINAYFYTFVVLAYLMNFSLNVV